MGLASLHNADREGQASIAHTDISFSQFIFVKGQLKLNDFNRARFILKYKHNDTNCPYHVGKNPGKWRSPEEYKYEPQSEKVDVYSFGNVIYVLLQEDAPFRDVNFKDVSKAVIEGKRPSVYYDVWNSTDRIVQTLKSAMMMCHRHDPVDRPTARDLETLLKTAMKTYDPGTLESWGDA